MDKKQEHPYTTEDAAKQLGRNLATVRNYVYRHDLGIWIGAQRFLSDADIATIKRARAGAPRKSRTRKAQPAPATTAEPT